MFVYNNFQVETPALHTSLRNKLIVFFHYVISKCTLLNLKCMWIMHVSLFNRGDNTHCFLLY